MKGIALMAALFPLPGASVGEGHYAGLVAGNIGDDDSAVAYWPLRGPPC